MDDTIAEELYGGTVTESKREKVLLSKKTRLGVDETIIINFRTQKDDKYIASVRLSTNEAKKLLRCDAGSFLDWGKRLHLMRRSSCEIEGKIYTLLVFIDRDPKEMADRGLLRQAVFVSELRNYDELPTKKYIVKTSGPPFSSVSNVEPIFAEDPVIRELAAFS